MKKLSVHINRKLTPNLRHNDRSTKETHQNVFAEKSSLNQCDKSAKEAMREINQLYKEAMEKMKGKKGKRTPKENSYLEMIFEVDENHTLEDCQKLADEICEITNFRRIQITLHKDEGHYEKDGSFKTHYHAHAVFFTLDEKDGKQLARKEKSLSDTNLANFHKLAYKVLRGEEKIKGEKKEYINDYREYKKIKAQEQELREREEELEKTKEELKKREEEIKKGEESLKAKKEEIEAKESELEGKELKEQEYKHYQELLELYEDKDSQYFSLGLNNNELVKKNLEVFQGLSDDVYEPLKKIFFAEYINKTAEKSGLDLSFTNQYYKNGEPTFLIRFGRKQKYLTPEALEDRMKYPTQEDINSFEIFQTASYLATILKENHKTFKEMGLTDYSAPHKLRISEKMITAITKLVKESKSQKYQFYGRD